MRHLHEKIAFQGPSGSLAGTLQVPDGPLRGGVVLSHCFTCSKSLKVTRAFATGIEDGGYAVLRYDFTGLGESEGDFAETTVTANIGDIEAAAGYLEERGIGPLALVGHSLGGTATLLAADAIPSARAVAVVAAPFQPDHVRRLFADDDVETALRAGRVDVSIAGRPFAISSEFFRDLERHCSPERIAQLGRPLLVVHGTRDTVVTIGEGERIFGAAGQPKWFTAIPDGDHLFLRPEHAARVGAAIVAFLRTTL